MNIKQGLTLVLFSSLIFSCAHKITYKVSVNDNDITKNCYDIEGKLEANNLESFKLKIIPHFCYILTREDIAVEINEKPILPFNYTYQNNELEISNKLIDGDVKITVENIDLDDSHQITHNVADLTSYSVHTASETTGTYIYVKSEPIVFVLETNDGKKVPTEKQINDAIIPSDPRFYDQGAGVVINRTSDTHVDFTIPSKMLGCNIEVRIPEATV